MKFLVIGLGSMGKRRIRCLKRLGVTEILGFDLKDDRREEARSKYGIDVVADWAEAKAQPADAWIVSTPPDTHVTYGLQAVERNIAFFTEAGVTDPKTDVLIARLKETRVVGAPSCTMRYYFGPRRIKRLIADEAIGRPLSFTYHCGQYLPDWHPWESYKDFYVSHRRTGACCESCRSSSVFTSTYSVRSWRYPACEASSATLMPISMTSISSCLISGAG